ncbi:MAG: 5-(carboxyamino)imidazole ribonucleotide mutase [Candidatus Tectomicrobia bacterium]|nr:5-(carboxyamino)imidazole ribonucleotide mutase [Candidatus Tectomicrobia bacterium]
MSAPPVGILMGSDGDHTVMSEAFGLLQALGVPYEFLVASAHRSPERVRRYVREAEARGVKVFIAGAGGAAHLAGVVAAETLRPVIGVPLESALQGLDSLLSTVQMPKGVPVAGMAVGKAGAHNAALLAAEILALGDDALAARLKAYREEAAASVAEKSKRLGGL